MVGKTALIVNDPIAPVLNGMAGRIIGTKTFGEKILYTIEAENYGPYLVTGGKEKKVRAWKAGDKRSVTSDRLKIVE